MELHVFLMWHMKNDGLGLGMQKNCEQHFRTHEKEIGNQYNTNVSVTMFIF